MASIQQSIGGLTGSIFAATAMGSHLIQGSPEYQAGKIEKEAEKLRVGSMDTAAEEVGYEKSRELEEKAAKLAPTPERLARVQEIQWEREEEAEIEQKRQKNYQQKQALKQRDIEEEEARRQIGRIIMEAGRRDLSRQTTLDYASQIEKFQKEFAAKGGNQQ